MMLPMLLLAIIPINIIQTIGVIIIVFLGYFFKQFSDKLMDKIDYDGTAKLIRFIAAMVIIVAEILLITGYTLPSAS